MKIQLLTAAIVGGNQNPQAANWVGEVDDSEAEALIASGYAKKTNAKATSEGEALGALNDNTRLPAGTVDSQGNAITNANDNAAANTEANRAGAKGKPTEQK
jgi:hypothetical protein